MQQKKVLDPCCGAKKFYFVKDAPCVLFGYRRATGKTGSTYWLCFFKDRS